MKKIVFALLLAVCLVQPAWAGLGEALAAFDRGDYTSALKECKPLAEAGDPLAQAIVGSMYYKGHGVPQDYVKAHMWFNLAAAQVGKRAAKVRDMTASKMTPQQIAEAQRLAREWKPKPPPKP